MNRWLLVIGSFLLAIITAFPTLTMIIAIAIAAYTKYVSAFFCLIFAWNVAKLVEPLYKKHLEEKE